MSPPQVGYLITPKDDTTLNDMLALGLGRFVEELTAISSMAAKEFSLEKASRYKMHTARRH